MWFGGQARNMECMHEDFPSSRCDVIGHISRIGIKSYVSASSSLANPTQPQCIKRNITFAQASSFRFSHFETLKQERRLLYNGELTRAMNREPGQRYEILKIWVPTHGVINVYRSPRGGRETVLKTYSIARKMISPRAFFCSFFQSTMWITAAFLESTRMSMVSRRYEFCLLMELLLRSRETNKLLKCKTSTRLNQQH